MTLNMIKPNSSLLIPAEHEGNSELIRAPVQVLMVLRSFLNDNCRDKSEDAHLIVHDDIQCIENIKTFFLGDD